MMTRIHTIGGFTETPGQETGMHGVYRQVVLPYEDRRDITVDAIRQWKADWKDIAAAAKIDGISEAVIIAYSWGAGWGAQRLAEFLSRHNIPVSLMILCDPVYRPTWLPSCGFANLLGFRALIPNSARIKIPENVINVAGVRQNKNRPSGHPLLFRGKKLLLPLVNSKHTAIDSSPEWSECVRRELQKLLGDANRCN